MILSTTHHVPQLMIFVTPVQIREPRSTSVFQCFVLEDKIVDISMKEIREDDFTFSDEDFTDIELSQSAEEIELLESTTQVSVTAIVQTCDGVLTLLFSNRKVAAFPQGQSKFKSSDICSGFDCLGQGKNERW